MKKYKRQQLSVAHKGMEQKYAEQVTVLTDFNSGHEHNVAETNNREIERTKGRLTVGSDSPATPPLLLEHEAI